MFLYECVKWDEGDPVAIVPPVRKECSASDMVAIGVVKSTATKMQMLVHKGLFARQLAAATHERSANKTRKQVTSVGPDFIALQAQPVSAVGKTHFLHDA